MSTEPIPASEERATLETDLAAKAFATEGVTALRQAIAFARKLERHRDSLLEKVAALEADKARLDFLQSLLTHPNYWQDLVLAWDHEDGVWLSKIRRGDYVGARPMECGPKSETLRAAIDSVMKGEA